MGDWTIEWINHPSITLFENRDCALVDYCTPFHQLIWFKQWNILWYYSAVWMMDQEQGGPRFDTSVAVATPSILPCKGKRQYLLTLQVSRYCLLPLQGSIVLHSLTLTQYFCVNHGDPWFSWIWNHHKCLSYLLPLYLNTYVISLRPI